MSRTTEPISIKLGTKACLMKGIQVCPNEGRRPFPREDNYEIANIHRRNLKIFLSRTTEPISIKLGTKACLMMGIQVCPNEGRHPFPKEDNYEIANIDEI